MKRALLIAVLVGVGGTAHAGGESTKALKKWFADLTANPDAAAKFTAGCKAVILPRADGVTTSCTKLSVADLLGPTTGTVTFKVKKAKESFLLRFDVVGADVDVTVKDGKKKTVKHLRVSAMINEAAQLQAAHFGFAIKDKDALAAAKAGTLAAPAAIADKDVDQSFTFYFGDKVEIDRNTIASWADYKDAFVLGSGPGQTYVGKSGSKKIRKWKVELAKDSGLSCGLGDAPDNGSDIGASGSWCFTTIKATVKSGGKDVTMTYRVSIYFMSAPEDDIWVPLTHFSLAE